MTSASTSARSAPPGPKPREGAWDPDSADVIARRARWFAAGLVLLQFALYRREDGGPLPYSRWWGLLPAALLVLLNLEGVRRRWRGADCALGWAMGQVLGDAVIVSVLIGMFSFDGASALWTLMILPVLEAAARGWSRRAIAVFAILSSAYVVREIVAVTVFDRAGATVDAVTFRVGFLGIVTLAVAGLGARLSHQLVVTAAAQAEAEQLRALAVATRRMSSLDVPTVVREVTRAAEGFGFLGVQLRSRAGVVLGNDLGTSDWQPDGGWFEATVQAIGDDGHAVLAGERAAMPLAEDEVLVVASVTAGESVEALLVGRHGLPVSSSQTEGLALLAAQASAALANALRYEEGRAFEERLAHQATHDSLTGLPNRALLRDRARSALARGRRRNGLVAVMFIDLDRFKEINDVLGHATGDALLREVARRVTAHLRPEDTCARVGGDEFVVVTCDHPDESSVVELAHRVRAAMLEPFHVDGLGLDIEASIGLAWAPTHGDDVDVLLRRADVAMYAAKARREGVVVYSETDDRLTPVHLTTLGDLRRALDADGQLVAYFQPIVELTGARRPAAVEALVRWFHPVRGLVPPDEFIPVAEGTTVIHRITDHVLDQALASLREWSRQGLDLRMAVNLSTRTLLDVSFDQRLESLLQRHDVDPGHLRLEITESALLADPTRAIATMHRLRDQGLRLSIDDFGTGYSSMSYLKSLPVDQIKIDRSFVTDMRRSARDGAVVHSVVDLAHSLGLQVVAEGVEDASTLEALAAVGCDLAQGYHVGRPMPADDLLPWAAGWAGTRPGPLPAPVGPGRGARSGSGPAGVRGPRPRPRRPR